MNCEKHFDQKYRVGKRSLFPLVALGGGLITAAPASALELGELTVESRLGQPLRASIAYALAPNEMVSDSCVSLGGGRSTGDLPGIGRATVSITDRAIVIRGATAVREPMLGTRVTINCPYTPNLSREYMLFVDPAGLEDAASVAAAPTTAPVARPESEPRLQATPVASVERSPRNDTPIGQSTRYQVRPGDTLSGIVQRIENRSLPMWPAINVIVDANPDAFIDNDPNRLQAGSWLTIPSLDGTAPVLAAAAASPPDVASAEPDVETDTGFAVLETAVTTQQAEPYEPGAFDTPAGTAVAEESAADTTADLKPGDLVPGTLSPGTGETVAIPDTELEGPETTASSPNVPTAIISTGARSESTSLLTWLIGGGLAIIVALLLFGRRARTQFSSTPVGPAVADRADRRQKDADPAQTFEDYDLDDNSPTDENPILDADLELGTGLDDGVEVDVAQDFGFAATTELDIELPFEPKAPAAEKDTDIIPAMSRRVESILESEVLPGDDDYDMSVIMDATKMPRHDDVTERDLQAVEVKTGDDTIETDDFTVSKEVDYDILEQDYEDEMTATQALNQEIERAAAELARDLNESVDDEDTSTLPEAAEEDLTATSEMPSRDEKKSAEFEASFDPDDTNAVTVNMSSEDDSAELAVANDDETVEMEADGGKVDTRRR